METRTNQSIEIIQQLKGVELASDRLVVMDRPVSLQRYDKGPAKDSGLVLGLQVKIVIVYNARRISYAWSVRKDSDLEPL